MGLGTITLLGMLLTPGQAPADVTTWNSSSMKIPIDYHPGKRGEIKELLLYVSADQGQTWQQHAVALPDRDAIGQPLIRGRLDLAGTWHTHTVPDDLLS